MPDETRDAPATAPAPAPAAPSYVATPLTGPTVPYTPPASAHQPTAVAAPVAARPRRRRGLMLAGAIAAAVLVVGLSFGGGVAVGWQLGEAAPGTSIGGGFGGAPDGDRPEPPGGFGGQGPGAGQGGQNGQGDGGQDDGGQDDGGQDDGGQDGSGTDS